MIDGDGARMRGEQICIQRKLTISVDGCRQGKKSKNIDKIRVSLWVSFARVISFHVMNRIV